MKIKHLGIIPDGNRRWSRQHGVSYDVGYRRFSDNVIDIINNFPYFDIDELTFYLASKENLSRDGKELEILYEVLAETVDKLLALAEKNGYKVTVVGIENIPDKNLYIKAKTLQEKTALNKTKINLLMGYNPFDEINSAIVNGKVNLSYLAINTPVDLVIRTAGNPVRLSNFLPLQCGYANIEVIDKYFIDLTVENVKEIIVKYSEISPNYGK